MTESDFVFAGESANSLEPIWKLIDQVISGPDGLGCFRGCSRLVCGHCSGSRVSAGLSESDGTIHLHNHKFLTRG